MHRWLLFIFLIHSNIIHDFLGCSHPITFLQMILAATVNSKCRIQVHTCFIDSSFFNWRPNSSIKNPLSLLTGYSSRNLSLMRGTMWCWKQNLNGGDGGWREWSVSQSIWCIWRGKDLTSPPLCPPKWLTTSTIRPCQANTLIRTNQKL